MKHRTFIFALLLAALSIPAAAQVTLDDNALWTENSVFFGSAEAYNRFGTSLAVGNFDDDPFGEVAVGAPGTDVDGQSSAGRVYVLQGRDGGLTALDFQIIDRGVANVAGVPVAGSFFGTVLAVGNFNGDAYDDLAVGQPNDSSQEEEAGSVQVFYGTPTGLSFSAPNDQLFDSGDFSSPVATYRMFGEALATGDFDDDGYDDLAIGSPDGNEAYNGSVHVLYGSASGLALASKQTLRQGEGGLTDSREAFDYFGGTLTSGDFDGDGFDDLAVGAKTETTPTDGGNGAVHLVYGGAGGLSGAGDRLLLASQIGGDTPEAWFGSVMTSCDIDDDGDDDLILGVPKDDTKGTDVGAVYLVPGSPSGPIDAQTRAIHPDDPGIGFVAVNGLRFGETLTAGDFGGSGGCDLAVGIPRGKAAGQSDAGYVAVLPNLSFQGSITSQLLFESLVTSGGSVAGTSESGDFFGFALAAGYVDGDSAPDLLVGSLEDIGALTDAGAFHIFLGRKEIFADGFESGDVLSWSDAAP